MSKNQVINMQQKIEMLQHKLARLAANSGFGRDVRDLQKIAAEIDNECQDMYLSALHIPIAQRDIYRSENPYV